MDETRNVDDKFRGPRPDQTGRCFDSVNVTIGRQLLLRYLIVAQRLSHLTHKICKPYIRKATFTNSQCSLMGKDRLHNSDTQCMKLHTFHKYPIVPFESCKILTKPRHRRRCALPLQNRLTTASSNIVPPRSNRYPRCYACYSHYCPRSHHISKML